MLRRRGYTRDIPNTTHFQMPLNDASKALAGTLFLRSIRFRCVIVLHCLFRSGASMFSLILFEMLTACMRPGLFFLPTTSTRAMQVCCLHATSILIRNKHG